MRKAIITTFILTISCLAWAQSDTTVVKRDTIPQVPENPVQVEPEEEPEPRIIYYNSDDDPRSKSSYRSRTRTRGSRNQIKTLSGSMSHSGGFGALSFKTSDFRDETIVMAGVRGGWIINRTLALGAEGYGIIPTAKYSDFTEPSDDVHLLGGYGGLFLELIFFSNEVVHVTFPLSGGAGWIGYDLNDVDRFSVGEPDNGYLDQDVFWYVEPGANVEVNVARNFRLAFGISKRFTQDLELVETRSREMENLNYYLTLKIGRF
ncbi:MAG: hypothetical protein R8G66_00170 [Cytophagales bacterium]|nr:hypothetical protein [Cytophagales bacterium]